MNFIESIPTGFFAGGQWREATSGDKISVMSPHTGAELLSITDTSQAEWEETFNAALAADQQFRRSSVDTRVNYLHRLADLVDRDKETLAHIVSLEAGKPLGEALGEIDQGNSYFRWYASVIRTETASKVRNFDSSHDITVVKEAVGPALLITPWNFPFAMVARKVSAALAAGCVSILKPAAVTPLTAAYFAKLVEEADLPAGVFNYVPSSHAGALSSWFMAQPRLRKISFTGSTGVGKTLIAQSAEQIQAVSMELGGNAPFLVFPDADLEEAIEGAVGAKFRNAGQACVAANRIIVHEDLYEQFVDKFAGRVSGMQVDQDYESSEMGALVDPKQLASTIEFVQSALTDGGEILAGGNRIGEEGNLFEPTVVVGLGRDSRLWREEIFGPVAAVYKAESVDQMIEMANDTEYGLVAYVYATDSALIDQAVRNLDVGMVAVNRAAIADSQAPFGGVKASGIGREGGFEGLDEFRVTKYVSSKPDIG